jgi:glycosyltransferase involved in cell wall biosynthesis
MFSVIVPTYNRVALLERTLASLFGQSYADLEIIVVNDGSSDGTDAYLATLASKGRITYISQANSGPSVARKAGLRAARGEIVAFTDDDCVPPEDWLTRIAARLSDPAVAGVGGGTVTGHPGSICAVTNDLINNYFKSVLNGRAGVAPYLTSNNVAYRKSALERAGGHDPRFQMGAEDRDLDYRITLQGGSIVYDPSIIVYHYNDADLAGFARHQFRQGKGSYLYYSVGRDGRSRPPSIPLRAYGGLLVRPFRTLPFWKALSAALLIVLAQLAVAAGFFSAVVSHGEARR